MIVDLILQVALLGSAWVLYLLLALSVFSIGSMVERLWFFSRRNFDSEELSDQVLDLLEGDDPSAALTYLKAKEKRSLEAGVVAAALRYYEGGPNAFSDAVDAELIKTRQEMERGSNLLGTLGNNAPFIGLLGTVIGVIIAFQQLGKSQGAGAMGGVMSGIAEALVATGVGLFVAIPAVVGYNLIQGKIGHVEGNVQALAKRIGAVMKAKSEREQWKAVTASLSANPVRDRVAAAATRAPRAIPNLFLDEPAE